MTASLTAMYANADERSPAKISSEECALRLRRGKADAVQVVRERVTRILAFRNLDLLAQERDDLVQEAMMDIWQAVNRQDFDTAGGFWGFVEVVTARRCIDFLRRRRPVPALSNDISASAEGPLDKALQQERIKLASQIVAELDPGCRRLLVLRYGQRLSYSDIAEEQGRSPGALRVQFYRCIQSAQAILQQLTTPEGGKNQGKTNL